jgi:hypothetical protein
MKKFTALIAVLFLVMAGLISCGKAGGPKAGTAKSEDMLKMLPVDADGVFFVDVHRAMGVELVQKALTKNEDLQEFIEKTNIDPREDIYFLAGAMKQKEEVEDTEDEEDVEEAEEREEEDIETEEELEEEEGEDDDKPKEKGVVVVNLRYDKETLLPLIREKVEEEGGKLNESEYDGYTVYGMWQDDQEVHFSFLDESNILAGNPIQVQSVFDVIQNKKDNVFKNEDLADLVSKTNRNAIFWGAVLFKPGTLDKMTTENPMLEDLKDLQSASLAFDYKNQNFTGEIKLRGGDETKNKQLAEFLTGIKAFGAMMAGEKPEIGELLNKIEITSGPEHVQINASIPEELINSLSSETKPEEEKEEKEDIK